MAATTAQAYWIADQTSMLRRVKFLATKAAVAVMAEDAGTANHAERVVYAKTVLDGTYNANTMAIACLTNSTIQAGADVTDAPDYGISDNDLEFAVNSLFNAMAGVATE